MIKKFQLSLLFLSIAFSCSAFAKIADLRILETTDLHANMLDYDYYKEQPTERFGFARTVSLIKQAQNEVKNSVLVDNGDLIQGSPIADFAAAKGLMKNNKTHPVFIAMNSMNYVVGNIGNHEFNFGLDFLNQSLETANYPYINANVYDAKTKKPYFKQYLIVETPIVDRDGNKDSVKIGYIGFVPPQIMLWDKSNLDGKVIAEDITETAKKLIPQMKKEGAEIIIAIPHSGLSADPYRALAENSVYYLSEVKDLDAIMFGHSHAVFPSKDFENIKGVNIEKGWINNVPAVMPGQWGDHLGVVDLVLEKQNESWKVIDSVAKTRPIFNAKNNQALVKSDENIHKIMESTHESTRKYMNQPIGESETDYYSYLATVQPDPSIQIINDAQKAYMKKAVQGDPDLDNLPILSAAAPFKAGGRKNDPTNYVEVKKGKLSFKNVADLYLYPNTIAAVKVKGSEIKEWLECASGVYNQIDPNNTNPQSLIDWDNFRIYNFDTISDLHYKIDITKPAKYNGNCELKNQNTQRIVDLTYNGKPIDPNQDFIIVANNYRVFTGRFAGTGADRVIMNSPDAVKDAITAFVKEETQKKGKLSTKLEDNWTILPIQSNTKLDIRMETSPSENADKFIKNHAKYPMYKIGNDEAGFAIYQINLQK